MPNWTATTTTTATPDQVLEVLTHPDEIRRWSPIDFELDDLDTARLAPGTPSRVTGRLAGVGVGFDVHGPDADTGLLELSADDRVGIDVRYEPQQTNTDSEVCANV